MVQLRSGKRATVDGPVPAAAAAATPDPEATSVPWVGITCMVLLALQYGLQPMLTSRYTPPTVNKTLIVLAQEAAKSACALTVMASAPGALSAFFRPSRLVANLTMAAAPAAIYSVQNWATQLAYQILDSVTFNCLNQIKLVSTALCVYFLFGQRQSRMQLLALALLLTSALLLQADAPPATPSAAAVGATQYRTGVLAILLASMLSGLASALCQHSLQRPQPMSSFELTLSMAIVSGVLMVGSLAVSSDGVSLLRGDLGGGLTAASWLPIVTNSLGGILVGQVTKHMGGVSKGFSIVGGLVVCGVVQSAMNRTMLPAGVLVALVMVIVATVLHTCYPPAKRKAS